MHISPASINKVNYNANLNNPQKKVHFSGVEKFIKYPEYDHLIQETSNGVIYPVIEKVKDFFIALTGPEATKFFKLKRDEHLYPLQTVVREAGKSHLLE